MIPVERATQPHVANEGKQDTLKPFCVATVIGSEKLQHNDLFQQTIRRKRVRI